jgi:hypothetical protein
MRQVYAHEAVVVLAVGADSRAPGGAITVALCGALKHDPPCPLAAHHTLFDLGRVRVLFATEPDRADEVRSLIDTALAAGSFTGPDGDTSHWELVRSGCVAVAPGDRDHARRLLRSAT